MQHLCFWVEGVIPWSGKTGSVLGAPLCGMNEQLHFLINDALPFQLNCIERNAIRPSFLPLTMAPRNACPECWKELVRLHNAGELEPERDPLFVHAN